jgi:hypothetical protein
MPKQAEVAELADAPVSKNALTNRKAAENTGVFAFTGLCCTLSKMLKKAESRR